MNKRQADRLLKVARALRESSKPEAFTMACFIHGDGVIDNPSEVKEGWCGTPACALGHYAARTDLQRVFSIVTKRRGNKIKSIGINFKLEVDAQGPFYSDRNFHKYFGFDNYTEAREMFGDFGCNNAKTPKAAARYIEQFVARKRAGK